MNNAKGKFYTVLLNTKTRVNWLRPKAQAKLPYFEKCNKAELPEAEKYQYWNKVELAKTKIIKYYHEYIYTRIWS